MKNNDTKKLELIYEFVDPSAGSVLIDVWESNTDKSIVHTLSWDPKNNVFIDVSKDKTGNVIERKEIDGKDIDKYSKWYSQEVLTKMKEVQAR